MAAIVVPARAESIKVARDWVERVLGRWGHDSYVAKVVVSELVTNVLKHTDCSSAMVLVGRAERGILVEVHDSCDVLPVMGEAGLLGESGRGLAMVGALVKDWGAGSRAGGGKVVWALLCEVA